MRYAYVSSRALIHCYVSTSALQSIHTHVHTYTVCVSELQILEAKPTRTLVVSVAEYSGIFSNWRLELSSAMYTTTND